MKKRVLILCTGNSCRSQMAEGFWRKHGGDAWEVFSAGLIPLGVNPLAARVMSEAGIDISQHTSDAIEKYAAMRFDLVVTVCDNVARQCPRFPGAARQEHWPFDDPARRNVSDADKLAAFRRVRDEIERRVRDYLAPAPPKA